MSKTILPDPPGELKQLSRELAGRLRAAMQEQGCISFRRYMEMALYEPGLGYYSAGLHKLGESGDFVTAPELGGLFAGCLAQQIDEVTEEIGQYQVLEVGAGSGKLAADILNSLDEAKLPQRYNILERSADLRQVQKQRIAAEAPSLAGRVQWLDSPPEEPWQGVLLANEVIDALAVERFQVDGGSVMQMCVGETADGFGWITKPAQGVLPEAVHHLEKDIGRPFANGYRSEILPHLDAWLKSLTNSMERGLALFIDYGYPRSEYYSAERTDGTVMCHYRQRAHDDVFFWPGLQDITAWVDFTALAEAADACGLDVEGYTSQAMFLVGCGLDRVLAGKTADSHDGGLAVNAEARQLTLPGMMGERFQVMGLGRGLERPLSGFSPLDLRYRL